MSDHVIVSRSTLQGIANALRSRRDEARHYYPSQMAAAITGIPPGPIPVIDAGITGALPPSANDNTGDIYVQRMTHGTLMSQFTNVLVNTGIYPKVNYGFEAEFRLAEIPSVPRDVFAAGECIKARVWPDDNSTTTLTFHRDTARDYHGSRQFDGPNFENETLTGDFVHVFLKDYLIINGHAWRTWAINDDSERIDNPVTVFGEGTPYENYLDAYGTKSVFKYFRIYDENDILIMCLVPALDNDGYPCFYDMVGGNYLYRWVIHPPNVFVSKSSGLTYSASPATTTEIIWVSENSAWTPVSVRSY